MSSNKWPDIHGSRVNPWMTYIPNDEGWDNVCAGDVLTYGRWDDAKDGAWIIPDYTCGSDYSGTLVERSNFNVLLDAAKAADYSGPSFFVELSGGHGTFALAFHVERTPEDIREMLLSLEDYPLADEDEHSQLEIEAQDAAWESYAASDYRRALEKEYSGDASEVTDDDLYEHFRAAMGKSNTYWENESGGSMYVDLDRVMERGAREMDPPAGFKPESEDA